METDETRVVDPGRKPDDRIELSLRPRRLTEIVGQKQLVENLHIIITAASQRKEPIEHVLFYGPPGLGKTTLSHVIANEMAVNIKATAGPAIERAGDLAAILTNLKAGDVLFIDEIHRLGKPIEEILYPAMEDCALDLMIGKGPSARALRLKLPPFTLIGATTRLALMSAPLRARFGAVFRVDYYDMKAMQEIVRRAAIILNAQADESGVYEIALRARGTPRVAIRLLKRVRDFSQVKADGLINKQIAVNALTLLDVDDKGLDEIDRKVIRTIIQKYNGGPVGLSTIAASISEEPDTIMEVVEPYLMQLGFVERTPQGRVATMLAYDHIHVPYPDGKPENQLSLFRNNHSPDSADKS